MRQARVLERGPLVKPYADKHDATERLARTRHHWREKQSTIESPLHKGSDNRKANPASNIAAGEPSSRHERLAIIVDEAHSSEHINEVTRLYAENKHEAKSAFFSNTEKREAVCSKIFKNTEFGYLKITIERPLRLNFQASPTRIARLDEHSHTPYHAGRFGGGLPDRPGVDLPPAQPAATESCYLEQLFIAYGDHNGSEVKIMADLVPWQDLTHHYNRQREFFYHAESLRNFARDTVPSGTFEELQDEVHAGVIEIEAAPHADSFVRVNAVTQSAASRRR